MILNGFTLSEFQIKAIQAIENGKHVLVTAHTGSGKTLPAEYAIDFFTKMGKKVIYTSPIKALSNQKFNEFTTKFSHLDVGIFTGDNKHNPNADVLIMTTEILQNKLFNPKASHLDFSIDTLGCVIFDEVHYIDDEDRGTVWEQTIIMLPNHIQMVMLSATIGEKEQFAKWIERIKENEVVICETNVRVVPLYYYTYITSSKKIFENTNDKKIKEIIEEELVCFKNPVIEFDEILIEKNRKGINYIKNNSLSRKHVLNNLCCLLREKEMFPALCFVFSRRQVEEMAKEISVSLFMENEKDYEVEPFVRQLLVSRVKNWKEYMLIPEYRIYLELLNKGIGIHHAGMLPIFREMIEILYEKKYIKLLFATETFAIGLNMPTKTVCFSSLYKHDGLGNRLLQTHEFTQMAGRAGRRNIDTIGNVILLTNLYEPPDINYYYKITNSSPKVLKSKFKIGYNLVLHNEQFNKEQMIEFVNKSLMTKDIIHEMNQAEDSIKLLMYKHNLLSTHSIDCKKYREYKELEIKYTYSKNKDKHKLKKQMDSIDQSQFKKIEEIEEIEKQIREQESNYEYAKNYISNQIHSIYSILELNDFYSEYSIKKFAKNIHEVHPLAMTDLIIMTNYFNNYTSSELFGILSCFYDVKVQDEFKQLRPKHHIKELEFIEKRFNYYVDKETEYYLTPSGQDILQYDMMEYIVEWMEQCNDELSSTRLLQKLKIEKNIFTGDFIKCCLKLVNISRELETIEQPDFIEKIIDGRKKIMKFICTNESLYL
jgi:antiviral helicase SKI2